MPSMTRLDDLDTPAVLVDLDRLERNLAAMAAKARDHGVSLRPHIKTHKARAIARRQLDHGADGLSTAKLDEAAAMAPLGCSVFVAYPIATPAKSLRAAEMASEVDLIVGVDHVGAARALGTVAAGRGRALRVRIEIDSGLGRCGIRPDEAGAMARALDGIDGLEVEGVFTHAGHAYRAAGRAEVEAAAVQEVTAVREAGEAVADVLGREVTTSVGSTPTALVDVDLAGVAEIRPGNYVFLDRTQVHLKVADLSQCALSVLASVVSATGGRAVIDAGSKVFGLDQGAHGQRALEGFGFDIEQELRVDWLSEEHGVIEGGASRLRPGDRVRLVPNHACVVANLARALVGVRGDDVVEEIAIDAPGGGR
jgi:D-serine deaminase-like pyridoxal phosphate-dependent protein